MSARWRRRSDPEAVFAAIAAADVVLWTSPVYFYGLPAQAKALVDRSQRIWAGVEGGPTGRQRPPGAGGSGGGPSAREQLFTGSLLGLKYFFASFGARIGIPAPSGAWPVPRTCFPVPTCVPILSAGAGTGPSVWRRAAREPCRAGSRQGEGPGHASCSRRRRCGACPSCSA